MSTKLADNLTLNKDVTPVVDVANDLSIKRENLVNSWFAIGHYNSNKHVINYLYHAMTMIMPGQGDLFVSTFSVTDETTGKYIGDIKYYNLADVTVSDNGLNIKCPDVELYGDLDKIVLKASIENASVDLVLTPVGHPMYNGGNGRFDMLGMSINQYSLPSLESYGSIQIGSDTYKVNGEPTWFDRQWQIDLSGDMPEFIKNSKEGMMTIPTWGWMDLNIDNGDVISLWFLPGNKDSDWATVMMPDGSQRVVKVEPIVEGATDWFKNDVSPFSYPTNWTIKMPELDAVLNVHCSPKNQELLCDTIPTFNHYEAASKITGTYKGQAATGHCYVELIGNWTK